MNNINIPGNGGGAPPPPHHHPDHHHHHHHPHHHVFSLPPNSPPPPPPPPIGGFPHHHHQQQHQPVHLQLDEPQNPKTSSTSTNHALSSKKKRNLPGTPDPDAEVMALSPTTLMATNRFVCEICNKGFQRDQNLQLHRRGHNLPWKLRQRSNKDQVKKKVYICPEKSCVHHDPSRALGDLTGIKKHFSRKHGEKKWKCDKCSKKYAVQSDWKAHSKTCGTREYKCDCGTLFSRKDSFITHRAFCDALAEEISARQQTTAVEVAPPGQGGLSFKSDHLMNNRSSAVVDGDNTPPVGFPQGFLQGGVGVKGMPDPAVLSQFTQFFHPDHFNGINAAGNPLGASTGLSEMMQMAPSNLFDSTSPLMANQFPPMERVTNSLSLARMLKEEVETNSVTNTKANLVETQLGSSYSSDHHHHHHHLNQNRSASSAPMSATALLQKAAQLGSTRSNNNNILPSIFGSTFGVMVSSSSSNNNNINRISSNNIGRSQLMQTPRAKMPSSHVSVVATPVTDLDQLVTATTTTTTMSTVKLPNMNDDEQGGLTRDFLGMGGDEISNDRPFLPDLELAHFASMSSAMGSLNHFTTSN
ncbi:hypothetical protein Dimus_007206 [Dionaea muscipula]